MTWCAAPCPALATRIEVMRRDTRGEVFIEYLIVLGSVGLVAAYAFASLGPLIISNYTDTRSLLLSINP